MATKKLLKSSAGNHRRPQDVSVRYRHSAVKTVVASGEEREELLLRWGLFQTYGVELLENDPAVRDEPLRTLPERLAALLLTQSADQNGSILGLQLQTIADYLGACRETIAAILRAFARQDFVALGYRRIDILDFPSMCELAGTHEWEQFGDQGKERHGQMHLVRAQ